nr:MAG TPA: Protein of unknown function (DUF1492) [Caudoviricetes sp.]
MTAKEFMNEYRRIGERIAQLDSQIYDIEQTLGVKAISYDSQPSGGEISHVTEDTAVKLATLREKQKKLRDELWKKRVKIEEVIYKITDVDLAEVLRRRYIRRQTFEVIAEEMHMTERWIYILHGRALQEVEKNIKKNK